MDATAVGHVMVRIEVLQVTIPAGLEDREEDYYVLDNASVVSVEVDDTDRLLVELIYGDALVDLPQSISTALTQHLTPNQPDPTETGETP